MIVRILGEGQWDVDEEHRWSSTRSTTGLAAVDAGDE